MGGKGTSRILRAGVFPLLAALACSEPAAPPSGRSMSAAPEPGAKTVNAPPAITSLRLEPMRPRPGSSVEVRAVASDPDGDALQLRYAWTVDGVPAGGRAASLAVPERTAKEARIEVEVVASDGRAESEPMRASARIGNRPPVLARVRLDPSDRLAVGDEVVAIVDATDPDGDPVEIDYEWRVNDRPAPGRAAERFATEALRRGDRVSVRVSASDGDDTTPPIDSVAVEIGNSAPEITSTPVGLSGDGVLRYAVQVRDPDGDRGLRYELATAPEGARIDPLSGEVEWRARFGQSGTHPFEVVVRDGQGGETRQRFEVTVREVEGGGAAPPANAE